MTARLSISLAAIALALLVGPGCARGRGVTMIPGPAPVEPIAEEPTDDPEDAAGDAASADDEAQAPVESEPGAPATDTPIAPPEVPPVEPEPAPSATPADTLPPVEPEPPAPAAEPNEPEPRELQPVLLDGATERLRVKTVRELDEAQERIDELTAEELDEDDAFQLARAVDFVATARKAMTKGDVHRAANLTHKASVLLAAID